MVRLHETTPPRKSAPRSTDALIRRVAVVLVAALSLCAAGSAAAEGKGCIKHEPHEAVTFVLVDRTDKHDPTRLEALKQTFLAVREMVKPGERLIIGVSTAKASDTRVTLDLVRPKGSWLDSPLKVKARDREFGECVKSVEGTLVEQQEEHKASAILETLSFVAKSIKGTNGPKRVVIFSDMVENGPSISFLKSETIDTKKSLELVKKEKLAWELKDVQVFASGVGQGVSDKKVAQLEEFWKAYFTETGAELKFFGPVFLGPEA
jgi:hypothetical protein